MHVKKTKKGKFSIELSYHQRESIFMELQRFLVDESTQLMSVKFMNEADVMRHLYYSTLYTLLSAKDFLLQSPSNTKMILNRSEVIALMWMLRNLDHDMQMLDLKSSLHKQLH